jgi:glycosyltransferase involved in cell wall biosynthesis
MKSWLLVAGDFAPVGGMDTANHALAAFLGRERDVHLVTHRAWPDLHAMNRVVVHGVRRPFGHQVLGGPLLARAGRRLGNRIGRAHAIVNGGNCHVPGAVAWIHYVHAAYRPAGSGVVRRVKSVLVHRRDLANERRVLADAALIICNSRRTEADVVRHYGVERTRTVVIPYGCDASRLGHVGAHQRAACRARFGWLPTRPLVAFVGALGDRRKGFDTVFDAWMRLCADPAWDADLIVVGTGAERPSWERRARATGCGHRVRFLGFRSDVPELLAAADALVHPARYEAYGLSAREALCRGIPAIVTRSAGVAEEYPDSLGDLLIDSPDDSAELASRLRRWRGERISMAAAVVPLAERLRRRSWDQMSSEIAAAVENHKGLKGHQGHNDHQGCGWPG